ncbi:uncharacterized protein LACBIDRAFT_301524 [Laccaria bicolor S238N-H82]|uniref:Predicted protein n=1 Tax=Laccaria bicolor (strain S238N-H82 / ATCC MYA-4686) TaxID=486041 RepID=B0CNR1_LACBS|nr:uncharacterized protein LACBIDRAFT_301524 [Laccaria bicolor S238N-H82]EDR15979.1 predicted protein [Laccaria bicolor S238N-H82]|eukprot:XP_001874187.1 predicted protein [Laccaria bicolor S238N-H82]
MGMRRNRGFPSRADRSSSPEPIKEEEDTPDESRGNGHNESAKTSLMWSDIQKGYHFVQKKTISKKAVQLS